MIWKNISAEAHGGPAPGRSRSSVVVYQDSMYIVGGDTPLPPSFTLFRLEQEGVLQRLLAVQFWFGFSEELKWK